MNTPILSMSLGPLLALSLVACGDDDSREETTGGASPAALKTIPEVAGEAGIFSVLVGAVESAGLAEALSGPGPFTVFAPTDAAFARLPVGVLSSLSLEELTQILTYHVVSGELAAGQVAELANAETLQGEWVNIESGPHGVFLNGLIEVTTTDVRASNGVIHVIDSVLLPPSLSFPGTLVDAVATYPRLSTLASAVGAAELGEALTADNNGRGLTLLTPTNDAFAALGADLAQLSKSELQNILLYHTVLGKVDASSVAQLSAAETLQGGTIAISVSNAGVELNGEAMVIYTDVHTSNGIVHVIDAVLLP